MLKIPTTISEEQFLEGISRIDEQIKNCPSANEATRTSLKKHKLAFMLGFYQCMRVSEVAALQPANVDKDRGFLHILAAKGQKDRDVPIMPPVVKGLAYLPIGIGVRGLQKACKRVWPELHFHSLRHSGATFYLNVKKVDIRLIQQLLGHSRLDTTQIYTHVTPDNLKSGFEDAWK